MGHMPEALPTTLLEPDERGRLSLARIPGENADRYLARRLDDGTVILEPVVVLPVRALESLRHALVANQRRQSSGGTTTPLDQVLARLRPAQGSPAPPAARTTKARARPR